MSDSGGTVDAKMRFVPDTGGAQQAIDNLEKVVNKLNAAIERTGKKSKEVKEKNEEMAKTGETAFNKMTFGASSYFMGIARGVVTVGALIGAYKQLIDLQNQYERSAKESNLAVASAASGMGYARNMPEFRQLVRTLGTETGTTQPEILASARRMFEAMPGAEYKDFARDFRATVLAADTAEVAKNETPEIADIVGRMIKMGVPQKDAIDSALYLRQRGVRDIRGTFEAMMATEGADPMKALSLMTSAARAGVEPTQMRMILGKIMTAQETPVETKVGGRTFRTTQLDATKNPLDLMYELFASGKILEYTERGTRAPAMTMAKMGLMTPEQMRAEVSGTLAASRRALEADPAYMTAARLDEIEQRKLINKQRQGETIFARQRAIARGEMVENLQKHYVPDAVSEIMATMYYDYYGRIMSDVPGIRAIPRLNPITAMRNEIRGAAGTAGTGAQTLNITITTAPGTQVSAFNSNQ